MSLEGAPFPSGEWFDALVASACRSIEQERLGFSELRLAFQMTDEGGGARAFGVVFEAYDISSAGELSELSSFDPDAVVTGDLSAWREMFDNIVAHGRADGAHTFNALTIADAPLAITAADPLRRDRVFRFAETIQQLLDAASGTGGAAPVAAPRRTGA
jgi:hypothetical protein